jgi:hypothetical protein
LGFVDAMDYENLDNMPRSEWPSRNGDLGDKVQGLNKRAVMPSPEDEWMYFSEKW